MLNPYDTQESIPEALREHYTKREDGRWHADIPNEHPAVKHNAKLLSEKQAAETKATQLQSDLESAKASGLPRGHVAVARADAELLEKIKTHGTAQEIETKLTEHTDLKDKNTRREREDNLRAVAKELGYDNVEAFIRLQGLPEFEVREKDGQKTVIAKVKEGNTVVEKPAQEFIESSADIAPFLPALKVESKGTRVHGSSSNNGAQAKDVFTKIREDAGKRQQERQNVHPMFAKIPGRIQAQTGE